MASTHFPSGLVSKPVYVSQMTLKLGDVQLRDSAGPPVRLLEVRSRNFETEVRSKIGTWNSDAKAMSIHELGKRQP